MVTTCGGIEEDFIKCMSKFYIGKFDLDGRELRMKGINRTGNLLVPNDDYCDFEDWMMPILDYMLEKQKKEGYVWTPSKMIHLLGERINNEESVYYWAAKNNIPVFCPAITDGSIGDMLFFHSYMNPGLVIDLVQDIVKINTLAKHAPKSGQIIIGGGVVKHHVCNAQPDAQRSRLLGVHQHCTGVRRKRRRERDLRRPSPGERSASTRIR